MTKNELNKRYFHWMYQLVCNDNDRVRRPYYRLFDMLHTIDFACLLEMDCNRAEDGVDLRYRFGYEHHYDNPIIASLLDDRPCSVLEMMVALALRCEEDIMDDPEIGNRTGEWFWDMIFNLGLFGMDDSRLNADYVEAVILRFLNHEYEADGRGGLFRLKNCDKDLRGVEIWYQMCWYLNEKTGG